MDRWTPSILTNGGKKIGTKLSLGEQNGELMVKKVELEMNAAWLGVGDDVAKLLVPVCGWNRD